jgi:hypothetical protein
MGWNLVERQGARDDVVPALWILRERGRVLGRVIPDADGGYIWISSVDWRAFGSTNSLEDAQECVESTAELGADALLKCHAQRWNH